MAADTEVECTALAHLFTGVVNDLKVVCLLHVTRQYTRSLQALSSCWDEVGSRAAKLGASLKVTLQALCAFLDALQRIADRAAANGCTRDVGVALTRLCLRQRQIEEHARAVCTSLSSIDSLTKKRDELRQRMCNLEKQRQRNYARVTRGTIGRGRKRINVDQELVNSEREMVRAALCEQRAHYTTLLRHVQPALEAELHILAYHDSIAESLTQVRDACHENDAAIDRTLDDLRGIDVSATLTRSPTIGTRQYSYQSLISSSNSHAATSPTQENQIYDSAPPAARVDHDRFWSTDSGIAPTREPPKSSEEEDTNSSSLGSSHHKQTTSTPSPTAEPPHAWNEAPVVNNKAPCTERMIRPDTLILHRSELTQKYCDNAAELTYSHMQAVIPDYNAPNADHSYSTLTHRSGSSCGAYSARINTNEHTVSMRRRPQSIVGDEQLRVEYFNNGRSPAMVQRRASNAGKAPPPPVRRNSQITAATPTAPSIEVVRSRCTTPVDGGSIASMTRGMTYAQQYEQAYRIDEQRLGSAEPSYDDNKGERDMLLMQIRTGMEALLSRKPSKREHGLPRI